MNQTARPRASRYLWVFGVLTSTFVMLVVSTNYLVDPYLTHQWDSPLLQRPREPREKLSPWAKTYAVYRYRPEILYVGNSRTEVALPADPQIFGGRRVFNAALSGAKIGDAIAMLVHATAVSNLRTVVWGIDYDTFLPIVGNTEFVPELVASGDGYRLSRLFLDLKRALSLDVTATTIDVLLDRRSKVCRSSLVLHGQSDEACVAANLRARGSLGRVMKFDVHAASQLNDRVDATMPGFVAEVSRLCKARIEVVLYINPLHAIALESLYELGHGADMERWKRLVVDAADTARSSGCAIRLVDFSGFNSVNSEPVPQANGPVAMQNYWEASHYRTAVGRQILAKLVGTPGVDVPADFGIELDRSNIDAHIEQSHRARERYRANHPGELALLQQWFGPAAPPARP